MFATPNRIALLTLCALPALGFGIQLPGALPVATYISACGGSGQSPTVRTSYSTPHRPPRRPKSAPVEVFHGAASPTRAYESVGWVSVVAHVDGTGAGELTDRAMLAAREMGGDALVGVQIDDAASLRPPAGAVGRLGLRALVVRWSDRADASN